VEKHTTKKKPRIKGATSGARIQEGIHYRVDPETECWYWLGSINNRGYGVWGGGNRGPWGTQFVHRIMWQQTYGPIPDGLVIDHKCRVRDCVNPAHLRLCTTAENNRFIYEKWGGALTHHNAAKTHCPYGHEYTPENTYVLSSGSRACKQCARERSRKGKRKQQLAERFQTRADDAGVEL